MSSTSSSCMLTAACISSTVALALRATAWAAHQWLLVCSAQYRGHCERGAILKLMQNVLSSQHQRPDQSSCGQNASAMDRCRQFVYQPVSLAMATSKIPVKLGAVSTVTES